MFGCGGKQPDELHEKSKVTLYTFYKDRQGMSSFFLFQKNTIK
jgi:hypothetical protein